MPIKKIDLYHEGIEKRTTLSLRDASPGGPAKYDWSISQDYGSNEVKLTHEQMTQIVELVRSWTTNENYSLLYELRESGIIHRNCNCGCHNGSIKHVAPCRCQI